MSFFLPFKEARRMNWVDLLHYTAEGRGFYWHTPSGGSRPWSGLSLHMECFMEGQGGCA